MAITTTMAKGYAARMLFIAILCTVFGVWGIYDYAVAIPHKQRVFEQFKVLEATKSALEATITDPAALPESVKSAQQTVDIEWERVTGKRMSATTVEEANRHLAGPNGRWLELLLGTWAALPNPRTPPLDDETEKLAQAAYSAITAELGRLGTPEPPSAYDRATQWFFIASLPFAPWFFWLFLKARRQNFKLDDDGTLHFASDSEFGTGAWTAAEIADIDMSRWMAKSIAWVVKTDCTRLKLDAYVHKNLHLIIGAIASQKHPEEWDAEAKPVKKDTGDGQTAEGEPAESAEATAGAEGH